MHIGKRHQDVDFRTFPEHSIRKDAKRVDNTLGLLVKVASKHPGATKEVAEILFDTTDQVSLAAMDEAKNAHRNEEAEALAARAKREADRDTQFAIKAEREAAKARFKANKAKGSIIDRFRALKNLPTVRQAPPEAVLEGKAAPEYSTEDAPSYIEKEALSVAEKKSEKIAVLANDASSSEGPEAVTCC